MLTLSWSMAHPRVGNFFSSFSKGGRFVEHSILRCMTQRIRTARNFIYMENQYFLGSAYAWYEDQVIVLS